MFDIPGQAHLPRQSLHHQMVHAVLLGSSESSQIFTHSTIFSLWIHFSIFIWHCVLLLLLFIYFYLCFFEPPVGLRYWGINVVSGSLNTVFGVAEVNCWIIQTSTKFENRFVRNKLQTSWYMQLTVFYWLLVKILWIKCHTNEKLLTLGGIFHIVVGQVLWHTVYKEVNFAYILQNFSAWYWNHEILQ